MKIGIKSSCKDCGKEIEFNGEFWYHTTCTPRHPAVPINKFMKDTVELKPCPFCGNKNPTLEEMNSWSGEPVWFIGCENYNCYFGMSLGESFNTKQEAIEAWNTRSK